MESVFILIDIGTKYTAVYTVKAETEKGKFINKFTLKITFCEIY